jgi:diaminopimelate dehydrogenase
MKEQIRIGILGYGNLGKGVECAVKQNKDMKLAAVFTRRAPESLKILTEGVPVYAAAEAAAHADEVDVLILCGGSATDLPTQTPEMAKYFNVIDSFDTHARIPEHFDAVNQAALAGNKTAMISVGWDPGLFSLMRAYTSAILPNGKDYTFWGKGVSQGHSDAIRRIDGVADARQYTIPVDEALEAVRSGQNPELTTRQKHTREAFVVLKDGADPEAVRKEIVEMPNYFADYDTTVHFISKEECLTCAKCRLYREILLIRACTCTIDTDNVRIVPRVVTDTWVPLQFKGCHSCLNHRDDIASIIIWQFTLRQALGTRYQRQREYCHNAK